MEKQKVIISDQLEPSLTEAVNACKADRIFVLLDKKTAQLCWPLVEAFDCLKEAERIVIEAGDTHKSLEAVAHVWSQLQLLGATRHSLLVNLGGGMVTDLGGLAASTF